MTDLATLLATWKARSAAGEGGPTATRERNRLVAELEALRARQAPAIEDVAWRLEHEADQFVDDQGMIYLAYLRSILTNTPYVKPAPRGTDAAVGPSAA